MIVDNQEWLFTLSDDKDKILFIPKVNPIDQSIDMFYRVNDWELKTFNIKS